MLLRARYVVPVDRPPIENGAVLIEDGFIKAVGPAHEFPRPATEDFGDAVILPGFVNAHTHLELTYFAGQISPAMGFVPWISTLAGRLMSQAGDTATTQSAVADGVRRSIRAGVTTVGDITRDPFVVRPVLAESAIRAVSFGEVIGIGRGKTRWPLRLETAANTDDATDRLIVGISPHSPYTVEPEGIRACAERARALDTRASRKTPLSPPLVRGEGRSAPLCIHAAETPDEEAFTRRLQGGLVDLLKGAGAWAEDMVPAGASPIELIDRCGILHDSTLLAHANYVSDEDIALIARRRSSVAYCSRTHAAFGHSPHRFRDMLGVGINVCVGTDSLASNPSLSILEELRFLRERASDVPVGALLRMATCNGARALKLQEVCGDLSPGKAADLVVVPILRAANSWDAFLEDTAEPIAVYISGRQTSLLG